MDAGIPMKHKIALVVIVAMLTMGTSAVLGLGAGSQTTTGGSIAQTETTTATVGGATQNETANVTFSNQTSNDTAVVVQQVVVPKGGFVAVHTVNESVVGENVTSLQTVNNSTIGEELGNSTFLEPGTHENVTVRLNQSLNDSQVLIVDVHQDSNGNQQLDETDALYIVDGELVADSAFVTLEEGANKTVAAGTETTTEAGANGIASETQTTTEGA